MSTTAQSPGTAGRIRRALSRIGVRLLAFNVLLVFLPAAGVLFLGTYEQHLLEAQERTMVQEGRLLAAALASAPGFDAPTARAILVQLGQRHTARLRVLDRRGKLLADSARLGPRAEPEEPTTSAAGPTPRRSLLYRIGALPFRLLRRMGPPPARRGAGADGGPGGLGGPEVRAALAGRYGAATRVLPGGTVVLYSAIPIRRQGRVAGVVLVSRSTDRIRQTLYAVRLGVFKVFLASLAVALILTVLTTTTIVRPLARLRRRAGELLDRRGRLHARFEPSPRLDEIGDLERALAELSHRLEEHLAFTESFAADLAHELRNPLAAVRSAAERAAREEDPGERRRLLERIAGDASRIQRLLADARELTRIDARLDEEEREPVDLGELVANVAEGFRLRPAMGAERIVVHRPTPGPVVLAAPHRLAEVLENLLDNALGLSPPRHPVEVSVRGDGDRAVVQVADRGPGIPEEHLERIFTRFFSYRPQESDTHSGLGLATVKAIVEGYGGTITAANRENGGAVFTVTLPLAEGGAA